MNARITAVIGVLIIVAILAFVLLPVVTYTSAGYGVAGGTWNQWNARVSASYPVLGCGLLLDTLLTTHVIGNGSWTYSKDMPSPMVACFYHPTQPLGGAGGIRY